MLVIVHRRVRNRPANSSGLLVHPPDSVHTYGPSLNLATIRSISFRNFQYLCHIELKSDVALFPHPKQETADEKLKVSPKGPIWSKSKAKEVQRKV
jgi:hypothetical protein